MTILGTTAVIVSRNFAAEIQSSELCTQTLIQSIPDVTVTAEQLNYYCGAGAGQFCDDATPFRLLENVPNGRFVTFDTSGVLNFSFGTSVPCGRLQLFWGANGGGYDPFYASVFGNLGTALYPVTTNRSIADGFYNPIIVQLHQVAPSSWSPNGNPTPPPGEVTWNPETDKTQTAYQQFGSAVPNLPFQTVYNSLFVKRRNATTPPLQPFYGYSGGSCTFSNIKVWSGPSPITNPFCIPNCGDGQLQNTEDCDDHNALPDDGCGATCMLEAGYTCTGANRGACVAVCGDGLKKGMEGCDDGNQGGDDGCSADCTVESGFRCTGAGPGTCTALCGDGTKKGVEACDDGNTQAGDGCSSSCTVEGGFSCTGTPSICRNLCGNGAKDAGEQCDDKNTEDEDGCSASCAVEDGYACPAVGQSCKPVCGDRQLKGSEQCDDGNNVSSDGCTAKCVQEDGFTCAVVGEVCAPICGDGLKKNGEQCDDGNVQPGDGCSVTCALEAGWVCSGSPSVCQPVCGDGRKQGEEVCDDGNKNNGDGCSAACVQEDGWNCGGSSCVPVCGDEMRKANEACDDGNTVANDGCSPACKVEVGWLCAGQPSQCVGENRSTSSSILTSPSSSSARMAAVPTCGNGFLNPAEACDDQNVLPSDGCWACQVEPGWFCVGQPSQCARLPLSSPPSTSRVAPISSIASSRSSLKQAAPLTPSPASVRPPDSPLSAPPPVSSLALVVSSLRFSSAPSSYPVLTVQTLSSRPAFPPSLSPVCGNRTVEIGEECDSGSEPGFVCGADCRLRSASSKSSAQTLASDVVTPPVVTQIPHKPIAQLVPQQPQYIYPVQQYAYPSTTASGPGSLAIMAAGAAGGIGWVRRRRR